MKQYLAAVRSADLIRRTGKIAQSYGSVLESTGPDAFVGELCEIYSRSDNRPAFAEVIGLRDGRVLLTPYEDTRGISLGSEVIATGKPAFVSVGASLLGRVIDGFGKPLDGERAPVLDMKYPLQPEPINPLRRARIAKTLETGVRAIDALTTIGRGQRMGIFSGSGVGKSTLLGMIARNMNADVNVIALVGERGREVREFVEEILGPEGRARSVVVVATSDQPPLVRLRAALAASAIAEYFRDQGRDVVLTMDSLTRFAMAQREIGLSVGEPPTSRGYTPSVFAALPKLLERGGAYEGGGSITAFYTILLEGDDLNDPIGDAVRAVLDGHIALSRKLANQGHYPAIDLLHSISRLLPHLATSEDIKLVQQAVKVLSTYQDAKDLIDIGAYRAGANPGIDHAIKIMPALDQFLKQDSKTNVARNQAMQELSRALGPATGSV